MPVQWVHLGAGTLLIASDRGAWLQPSLLGAQALGPTMPGSLPATPEATAHLLDGAMAAAEAEAPAQPPPPMTARRWAWELVNQWFVATRSIALLAEASTRFAALGRGNLAAFTEHRLEEERGHDQFPLDDLAALGYDARRAVRSITPSRAARALVDYAADCVRGPCPVEFLGYVHALERHVIRVPEVYFEDLATVFPPGVDAATGLRAHASELDIAHVEAAVDFFAGLPGNDRSHLAVGCYRTTLIRNSHQAADPSSTELEQWLAPCLAHHRDHDPRQGVTP